MMDNTNDKKQKILEASKKIFFKDGYHKARISEIAQEAGIGKGTVYEYFDSKKQLFEKMLGYYIDFYCENLTRTLQQKENPIDKLRAYFIFAMENIGQHEDFFYLFEKRGQAVDREVRKIMFGARDIIVSLVEGIIKSGIRKGIFRDDDPHMMALIFLGAVSQISFNQITVKESSQKSFDEEKFLNILLKGIQKE